ncbi:DMT family transporter [Roseomonas terrae]|jgi:drug/metabolite transporter (DMT)-like permease|uniref:DMT family transporter n=1 Tax=Neoroseomonas terrae TaxID=424799 RepID=A0ABS5EBP4_9PROT|nr:DMT family transporter [Neoroseomonas terrae]MBR0648445.1 DMT family transporter [Neoroseomonas terrae]
MHDALRMLPPLFLLGTLWGVTPVFVKHLGSIGWPPLMIAVFGATGSSAILFTLCRVRRIAVPLDARHLRYYAVNGLFGMALANLVGFTSLQHIPAGFFAMLVPLSPIITVLGAALIGAERVTPRRVLGTALGLAGVMVAMSPGAALPDRSVLGWAMLAALTPVCYAMSNLFAARLAPQGTPPPALATGTLAVGAVQVAIFALLIGQFRMPPPEGLPISALQVTVMASAFLLWFRSIVTYGSVVTSQTGYIITLTGMAWGWLLFGERPGPLTIPAAMLIFAGLALVTLPGRRVNRSGA